MREGEGRDEDEDEDGEQKREGKRYGTVQFLKASPQKISQKSGAWCQRSWGSAPLRESLLCSEAGYPGEGTRG